MWDPFGENVGSSRDHIAALAVFQGHEDSVLALHSFCIDAHKISASNAESVTEQTTADDGREWRIASASKDGTILIWKSRYGVSYGGVSEPKSNADTAGTVVHLLMLTLSAYLTLSDFLCVCLFNSI